MSKAGFPRAPAKLLSSHLVWGAYLPNTCQNQARIAQKQALGDVVSSMWLLIPEVGHGGRDRTRTCDLLRVKQAL